MNISEKRVEIDHIDSQIITMLARRAALCREIAMLKSVAGLPIRDPQREAEVLRAIDADDTMIKQSIVEIFDVILHQSRELQRKQIELVKHEAVNQ